ncbi:MAG: hypothetical protein NVS4B7_04240 [Ktedonobacteraceae bacterium]
MLDALVKHRLVPLAQGIQVQLVQALGVRAHPHNVLKSDERPR